METVPVIINLPPAIILIAGGLLIPFFKGHLKSAWMLLLPILCLGVMVSLPEGNHWTFQFLDYDLTLGRVDRLSRVFGYIFCIVAFISSLFALNVKDDVQYVAGFAYAGGALGVTLAGDLISLYLFWEVMAVASTFLILARRTKASQAAAFRYVLVHIFGGLCLLAGIVLYIHDTGTAQFALMTLSGPASWLIFLGIAVNAAIPPLHPWLSDAYPEATVAGAVFLSAFTTKSAVYLMARTFAGTELLIYLGALMTTIPIFYAVLENDIRRVLAYSLINQVGFMMCGIGIGTALSINGTVSHAFCHILYKALLFMSAGAVLHMTGKIRCTDLGGLYKTMPLTCLFCIIGAASISAFPLFSGFVSKSMIVSAAAHEKLAVVWLLLQFASAGVFHHAGIKVPFFMFFGHDSGIRTKEPPVNMIIAMGLAAFLCVFIGVFPQPLYSILPFPVDYVPYTAAHVVGQLQLLMFGALAFCLLILSGYYPAEMRAINLDADWLYRKGGRTFYRFVDWVFNGINRIFDAIFAKQFTAALARFGENALFILLVWAVWPLKLFFGAAAGVTKLETDTKRAFAAGTVPIGIATAAAALFLVFLFWAT
jgi:multicomponent Na+:H+ antiporter subunit D